MKIVFLDSETMGADCDISCFKELGEFIFYKSTLKEELDERVLDAEIIITNKVLIDRNVMNKAKKLKYIGITATGTNNVDLEYAKEKGIVVTNVKGYSTESVAQHTFALLLGLLEQIRYYDDIVKAREYANSGLFTNLSKPFFELKNKTWGIMGLGEIGKRVAQIAEVFGCEVIYYSTSGRNNSQEYKRVGFTELLKTADIISIHAPLTRETENLINEDALKKMKSTGYLINVGRGPIVDERALAAAIDNHEIAGAGLDVFHEEPMKDDNSLLNVKENERLIMTPHIAWASKEARNKLVQEVYENIKSFQCGDIRNQVN